MRRIWLRSSRLYLAASVVLAVAAGLLVRSYVARVQELAGEKGPLTRVVVASAPIERGSTVDAEGLRVIHLPRRYAPPGSFGDTSRVIGRVALTAVAAGEALTATRLGGSGEGPIAALVPPGLRGFPIPTTLPAGAVHPGDHVDLLATYGSGRPRTETVAEGIEVLLILGTSQDDVLSGGEGGNLAMAPPAGTAASTLVVLVPPHLQERVAFARAFADLSVAIAPVEEASPP